MFDVIIAKLRINIPLTWVLFISLKKVTNINLYSLSSETIICFFFLKLGLTRTRLAIFIARDGLLCRRVGQICKA